MKIINTQFPQMLSGSNCLFQISSGQLFIYNDKWKTIYLIDEDIVEVAKVDSTVTFMNNTIVVFDMSNKKDVNSRRSSFSSFLRASSNGNRVVETY